MAPCAARISCRRAWMLRSIRCTNNNRTRLGMSILGLICVLLALVATLLFVLFLFQRRDLRAVSQLSLSVQRAVSGERLPQRIETDQEPPDLPALRGLSN